jgi:hypothetical protein
MASTLKTYPAIRETDMNNNLSEKDLERLICLAEMTFSTFDGEALNAIRKANELISNYNLTWRLCLTAEAAPKGNGRDKWSSRAKAEDESPRPTKGEIDKMFNEINFNQLRGSFLEFMDSIYVQWKETGSLSPKQELALVRAWKRATGNV